MNRQICFPLDDGGIICNAIMKNGRIIYSRGRWFRFKPYKKRKTT